MDGTSERVLVLNYHEGIRVSDSNTGKLTHLIPFNKLHSTCDDGHRIVEFTYDSNNKVNI